MTIYIKKIKQIKNIVTRKKHKNQRENKKLIILKLLIQVKHFELILGLYVPVISKEQIIEINPIAATNFPNHIILLKYVLIVVVKMNILIKLNLLIAVKI